MHRDVIGTGPDLVLLHGWAMHAGIFAPIVPALASRCTVHLVDLPGHGRSRDDDALDLSRIAATLANAVPGAVWVGWSLGGLVALEAARAHPMSVAGVGLIAANPCFVAQADWEHGVPLSTFETFRDDLERDYARTIERFIALECHGSDCAREEMRELKQHVFDRGEPAPAVLKDGLRILVDADYRDVLPQLAMPSTWIAGARDRLVPASAMELAARRAPGATFRKIAGGGHAPFIGHPSPVLEAIGALLDRVHGTVGA